MVEIVKAIRKSEYKNNFFLLSKKKFLYSTETVTSSNGEKIIFLHYLFNNDVEANSFITHYALLKTETETEAESVKSPIVVVANKGIGYKNFKKYAIKELNIDDILFSILSNENYYIITFCGLDDPEEERVSAFLDKDLSFLK